MVRWTGSQEGVTSVCLLGQKERKNIRWSRRILSLSPLPFSPFLPFLSLFLFFSLTLLHPSILSPFYCPSFSTTRLPRFFLLLSLHQPAYLQHSPVSLPFPPPPTPLFPLHNVFVLFSLASNSGTTLPFLLHISTPSSFSLTFVSASACSPYTSLNPPVPLNPPPPCLSPDAHPSPSPGPHPLPFPDAPLAPSTPLLLHRNTPRFHSQFR